MIDYLNPHHVYIDAQAAPDLSMEVKRDECDLSAEFRRDWMAMMQLPEASDRFKSVEMAANIIPETVDTLHNSARTDAERGAEIMDNRINQRYGTPDETPAERIIRLYRSGISHVDIARRGYDLADVRRVISEATAKDETLYQVHKGGMSLAELRNLAKKTQSDVAGAIGVTKPTYSNMEKYPENISLSKLYKICEAVNVPIEGVTSWVIQSLDEAKS